MRQKILLVNTTEEEDLSEQSLDTVKENDSKQLKPITRCAWYLSSGTAGCSDESNQGNMCDNVNVDFQEQEQNKPKGNNLNGVSRNKMINSFDENGPQHLICLTNLKTGDKSPSVLPYRPLLIRPPDKRYIKFPGFQTIDGAQKDKSEV